MLAGQSWRDLEGVLFGDRVRLLKLIDAERGAWFLAKWDGEAASDTPEAIAVRAYAETGERILERFLESRFLDHPNLLRCLGAGTAQFGTNRLVYAVMERPDKRLRDVLRTRFLDPGEAEALGEQLADGLAYLHGRNLVCCNLDPDTAVLASGQWKIADYSELREAGIGYAVETRRLVGMGPGTPPEAFEGLVLPAWDAWSLAVMLSASLADPKAALKEGSSLSSHGGRRQLPEPFQAIVTGCLHANPADRCTIDRVREILAAPLEPDQAALETDEPEPDDNPRWERQREQRPSHRWLASIGAVLLSFGILAAVVTQLPRQRPATSAARVAEPSPQAVSSGQKPSPLHSEVAVDTEAGVQPSLAEDKATIRSLLDQWAIASRTRDVEAQMACYAPRLERFYGAFDVPRDVVRRDREHARQLGSGPPVRSLECQYHHGGFGQSDGRLQ